MFTANVHRATSILKKGGSLCRNRLLSLPEMRCKSRLTRKVAVSGIKQSSCARLDGNAWIKVLALSNTDMLELLLLLRHIEQSLCVCSRTQTCSVMQKAVVGGLSIDFHIAQQTAPDGEDVTGHRVTGILPYALLFTLLSHSFSIEGS